MKYPLIQFLCSYLSGKLYLLRVKSRFWRFFPTLHNHYFRSWHILIYYRFVMNCFCNDIRTRWLMLREAHEELWTQCGDELVSVGAFIHYRPSVLCRRWWWRVCRWRHSAVGCKNPRCVAHCPWLYFSMAQVLLVWIVAVFVSNRALLAF